jgi:hypothetical protein
MNASDITHSLKVIGFNRSMLTGIAVIVLASVWVYSNRQQVLDGLFG